MYNNYQKKAIFSTKDNLVIVAPPGSGKTHTMNGAIRHYIDETNAKNVVAVTFTNKAAEELKNRLFEYQTVLHISTIHSWSYSELVKLSKKHLFRIKLLEEEQIISLIKPMMERRYVNPRSVYSVYHHCIGNINPDLPHTVRAIYDSIKDEYIKYKRSYYLYDFTDLPLYLKTKLEDNDEYVYVDAIFVDEFQDVDPVQLSVFNRVVAKKKFYIGDPQQAIYIFRGATEDIFRELVGFEVFGLKENYRSYQSILDYAYTFYNSKVNTILETDFFQKTGVEEHGVVASKGDGPCSIFVQSDRNFMTEFFNGNFKQEVPIEDILKQELESKEYYFLCRTNKQVKALQKLNIFDVSTIHKSKGLEFDNVVVVDFEIKQEEDVNVAFVALTRTENNMIIIDMESLEKVLNRTKIKVKSAYNLSMAF